jgi:predicted permease
VVPELADHALDRRDASLFQVVGRMKPGVAVSKAEAQLDTVARQLEQAYGEDDKNRKGRRVALLPGARLIPIAKQSLPAIVSFFMLLGGLVLVIAASNVAGMTIARAQDRRKEIAVRLALGAGRARLVRQLLTESMLLAAGAGVLGYLLCALLMHMASHFTFPYPMPIRFDVEPDGRVLLFALALTMLTGLAFGLAPALKATRTDLTPALKEGGAVPLRRHRLLGSRNLLVTGQIAASLALLLVTAFLVLGFQRTMGVRFGFAPGNVQLVSLDPIRDGYSPAQAGEFFPKLLDRLRAHPSLIAAGISRTPPVSMATDGSVTFSTTGNKRISRRADRRIVSNGYFEAIGLPVLAGRSFRREDEATDRAVVIVGEHLAREIWGAEDPVGRSIEIGDDLVGPFRLGLALEDRVGALGKGRHMFQVVGVARNERENLVKQRTEAAPLVYFPLRPADLGRPSIQGMTLILRAAPGLDAARAIRSEISAMDGRITPFHAHSLTYQLENGTYSFRAPMWTYGTIGAVGAILAAIGLAGVTAYSVAQRRREIGIRMALGAQRVEVLRLVMREGAALVAAGIVLGLAAAWALTRALFGGFSGVGRLATSGTPEDPRLLVFVPLALAALALAACYIPARRALKVDPVVALRQE